MALNPFVNDHTARLAELVACPDSDGPILTTGGILRVAARYTGQPVDVINRGSDGELLSLALLVVQCSERPIVRLARHKLRC